MAMRFLLLGVCSVLAARPTHLSKYTQDGVQELLTKWRLGDAFGKDFERLGFDGSVGG